MNKIDLYSIQTHGFCDSAKRLLRDEDISNFEIDLSSDPMLRSEMKREANGMRTSPQVCVNNTYLPGFAELYAMQQFGKLEKVLKD